MVSCTSEFKNSQKLTGNVWHLLYIDLSHCTFNWLPLYTTVHSTYYHCIPMYATVQSYWPSQCFVVRHYICHWIAHYLPHCTIIFIAKIFLDIFSMISLWYSVVCNIYIQKEINKSLIFIYVSCDFFYWYWICGSQNNDTFIQIIALEITNH